MQMEDILRRRINRLLRASYSIHDILFLLILSISSVLLTSMYFITRERIVCGPAASGGSDQRAFPKFCGIANP